MGFTLSLTVYLALPGGKLNMTSKLTLWNDVCWHSLVCYFMLVLKAHYLLGVCVIILFICILSERSRWQMFRAHRKALPMTEETSGGWEVKEQPRKKTRRAERIWALSPVATRFPAYERVVLREGMPIMQCFTQHAVLFKYTLECFGDK